MTRDNVIQFPTGRARAPAPARESAPGIPHLAVIDGRDQRLDVALAILARHGYTRGDLVTPCALSPLRDIAWREPHEYRRAASLVIPAACLDDVLPELAGSDARIARADRARLSVVLAVGESRRRCTWSNSVHFEHAVERYRAWLSSAGADALRDALGGRPVLARALADRLPHPPVRVAFGIETADGAVTLDSAWMHDAYAASRWGKGFAVAPYR